ncbi:TPA: Flp pilus assembly complex ATPase component, partial [Pseudomonas aeruginosa]|nr:Flp pilus assembly complex ATPase component [Pseudomonas aeruginosa]
MVTQLLTADGGEWEVSKHLQEIMALAADGTLYLSESHQNDIHVLSFIDRLERRGFRYQLNLTDLQTIHQLYRAVAMDGLVDSDGQRATQMQERVVKIIRKATELRASDVHFVVSPAGTGSKIRFRVDGLLKTVEQFRSQELHELCATIYQSMCDVAEPLFKPQLDQDARMSQAFVEKLNLFGARIATRPRAGGFLMILRLLYDDTGLDSLEQLGYLPEQNALFDRMMRMPYGINILSGPTGSGKSMTLKVTMEGLDKLHGGSKHILTIEDPPEYRIRGEGINQTPLVYDATDPDAERQAWAAGIANGMRLDPDYMMIGEVRDLFAAVAAFRGAMTGHGLWSTLHTNSAIGIVQRLKDLGVDPGLLFDPALLTGLINQSLLPKLCPHCKVRFQDHQDQLALDLVERVQRLTDVSQVYVKGPGCQACRGSGVNGRSIVAEVVLP